MDMDTQDRIDMARRMLHNLEEAWSAGDGMSAVRCTGRVMDHLKECVYDFVQLAYNQGAKKKDIALALDMPASYLRGLEKTS